MRKGKRPGSKAMEEKRDSERVQFGRYFHLTVESRSAPK